MTRLLARAEAGCMLRDRARAMRLKGNAALRRCSEVRSESELAFQGIIAQMAQLLLSTPKCGIWKLRQGVQSPGCWGQQSLSADVGTACCPGIH